MSTTDPQATISLEQARERIYEKSFRYDPPAKPGSAITVGRVGLEPEFFAFHIDDEGRPLRRIKLAESIDLVDQLAQAEGAVLPRDPNAPGMAAFDMTNKGRVTFEPGGQIEHSTAPHVDAATAVADAEEFATALSSAARPRKIAIAALGCDVFSPSIDAVPMQLDHWRYDSMQSFFDQRGEAGRIMMRHTTSCQVNLDFGPQGTAEERWLCANLVSPLVSAGFASGPARGAAASLSGGALGGGARALVWRGIDPSRTGFPGPKGETATRPFSCTFHCFVEAALEAQVMLMRHADGSGATVGGGGFRMKDWIQHGHPEHGYPTAADIDYHLTTLFFEVRPRGFLEIRGADALPSRYRSALVTFFCGLIYDDQARGEAVERLRRFEGGTEALFSLALEESYASAEFAELSKEIWRIALEGANRLPRSFSRSKDLLDAEKYYERFPMRGQAPFEELVPELDRSAEAGLAWARE